MQIISKYIVVTLLLVGFVPLAQAAETDKDAACNVLNKQGTANNVVYQPGMDAYGNPVAPADIQPEVTSDVINMIKVPLTKNLASRVAALQGLAGVEANAPLGMIEIHENGQVKYKGEDWTKSVKTLCGQSYKEVTVDLIQPEEPMKPLMEVLSPPVVERPALTNNLAVDERSARIMPDLRKPKVFEPAEPIRPLVGTPKVAMDKPQSEKAIKPIIEARTAPVKEQVELLPFVEEKIKQKVSDSQAVKAVDSDDATDIIIGEDFRN